MSSKINEVIATLTSVPSGSRSLDGQVASALGWTRRIEAYVDSQTGEERKRNLWLIPGQDNPVVCPSFTSSFQAAFQLANEVIPGHVGACHSENRQTKLAINTSKNVIVAASPALALCAAALKAIQ